MVGHLLRRAFLTTVCLLAPAIAFAGAPTLEFEASYGRRISRDPGRTNYPSGIAVDSNSGDVYIMDLLFNRVQRFTADGKFIAEWDCKQGLGLTVDPGNGDVWVAMWTHHKVNKYSKDGKLLLSLGTGRKGTAPGEFHAPHDVTVDPRNGDLYVMDTFNKRVQVFSREGEYKREFGGPFIQPFGISIHPEGKFIAVSNTGNRELLMFSLEGELIGQWKRPGHGPGEFRWPRGMDVTPSGHLFIADTDNERVQKLNTDTSFVQIIKGPDNRTEGTFHPRAVAVNHKTGDIYAAAAYSLRIDHFKPDGTFIESFAKGERDGPVFNTAKDVTVDRKTGDIYVSDWMGHVVRRFDKTGKHVGDIDGWIVNQTLMDGSPLPKDFHTTPHTGMWPSKEDQFFPGPIDVDDDGNLWALRGSMFALEDPRAQAPMLIRCFDKNGEFVRGIAHDSFPKSAEMRGIVVDSQTHHVYVSNTFNNTIQKFTFDGALVWSVGKKGTGNLEFQKPSGLALDLPRGHLYVVDSKNNRIQVLTLDGAFVTSFGSMGTGDGQFQFNDFTGLDIDPSGLIAVADTRNNRIQFFDLNHQYLGSFGEQGFGKSGRYNGVSGVEMFDGHIYIVDTAGGEVEVFKLKK